MKSLHQIGLECHTDKAKHGYLGDYEQWLGHLRSAPITLLEVGVRSGDSMRMWERFFEQGRIIGVDIEPDCQRHAVGRIEIVTGDQRDAALFAGLNVTPDIVIDDASHIHTWTLETFRILWPMLTPGGFYIVEDLHCVSRPRRCVTTVGQDEFFIPNSDRKNTPETKDALVCALLDQARIDATYCCMSEKTAILQKSL